MATKRKFEVVFNIDNAAFDDDASLETARILEELAENVRAHGIGSIHRIKDANGARIGFAAVQDYTVPDA